MLTDNVAVDVNVQFFIARVRAALEAPLQGRAWKNAIGQQASRRTRLEGIEQLNLRMMASTWYHQCIIDHPLRAEAFKGSRTCNL